MSGGGPSSTKQSPQCAARVPVLSRRYEDRVGATFDFKVYGLVLQFGAVLIFFDRKSFSFLQVFEKRDAGRKTFSKGFPPRLAYRG